MRKEQSLSLTERNHERHHPAKDLLPPPTIQGRLHRWHELRRRPYVRSPTTGRPILATGDGADEMQQPEHVE